LNFFYQKGISFDFFSGGNDRGCLYGCIGITSEKWHESCQRDCKDEFSSQGYGNDVQYSSQTKRAIEASHWHAFW